MNVFTANFIHKTAFSAQKRRFGLQIASFCRREGYAAWQADGMHKPANRHATAIQLVRSWHAEWVRDCCGMSAEPARNLSETGQQLVRNWSETGQKLVSNW